MFAVLRKVQSVPNLIKRRKSRQKLEKLCFPPYDNRLSHSSTYWPLSERRHLLEKLVDYFIVLHESDDEEQSGEMKVWYWENDIDEEYPVTCQLGPESTNSDSLSFYIRQIQLDSTPMLPLATDRLWALLQYFRAYRPPPRL